MRSFLKAILLGVLIASVSCVKFPERQPPVPPDNGDGPVASNVTSNTWDVQLDTNAVDRLLE